MAKKILLSSEWSQLGTGYSNYYRELAEKLCDAGHEVIEYASYCQFNDPKRHSLRWKVIPAVPRLDDENAMKAYNAHPSNQFGALYFDAVCAQVKPDIVIDIRDPWYFEHVVSSPARRFFNLILTPTIDSRPQKPEWIWEFAQADIINNYSYFGKTTLIEEGSEFGIKPRHVTPAGVDKSFFKMFEDFKGENKDTYRKKYNFPKNAFIFSFTSRNQRRKLFPETAYCFDDMISNNKSMLNCYLHFHTSWPDKPDGSWDFTLMMSRIKNPKHILFTYICSRCKHVFISPFGDSMISCPKCNSICMMPGPGNPVPREQQKEIMYSADVGLQIAIGEGQGMCWLPDSKVKIKNYGLENIQDVVIGNTVVTHTGSLKKVTDVFKREYSGNIIRIKTLSNYRDLTVTPEHPVLIIKSKASNIIQWIPANKIEEEDFIVDIYDKTYANNDKNKLVNILKNIFNVGSDVQEISNKCPMINISRNDNNITYSFISETLGNYVRDILTALKIPSKIDKINNKYIVSINGYTDIQYIYSLLDKKEYVTRQNKQFNKNDEAIIIADYIANKVKEITIEQYEGYVYNLEVEDDHSYSCNGYITHNCIAEYKALGIPVITVPWSAMEEQGKIVPGIKLENDEKPHLGGRSTTLASLWLEPNTLQYRAYPNWDSLAKEMTILYTQKQHIDMWKQVQTEAYEGAKSIYTWEKTSNKYLEEIDILKSTQHIWQCTSTQMLDVQQVMNMVLANPIDKRIAIFYDIIKQYIRIPPNLLSKWHSDLCILTSQGTISPSYNTRGVSNEKEIYGTMENIINKINAFQQARISNMRGNT